MSPKCQSSRLPFLGHLNQNRTPELTKNVLLIRETEKSVLEAEGHTKEEGCRRANTLLPLDALLPPSETHLSNPTRHLSPTDMHHFNLPFLLAICL